MRLIGPSFLSSALLLASCEALDPLKEAVTHRALLVDGASYKPEALEDVSFLKFPLKDQMMKHRLLLRKPRGLQDNNAEEPTMNCDGAFLACLGNDKCAKCFEKLHEYNIDWASVAKDTQCAEVASFLAEENICTDIQGDAAATTAFCQTFHSCAFWTAGGGDSNNKNNDGDFSNNTISVDCTKLTECKWDGMHESFIGDGICHENIVGECYNTAICKYDGGDCCEDTCKTAEDSYVTCGHDGYACRDPDSKNCDGTLTMECKTDNDNSNGDNSDKPIPTCETGQTPYRLVMYDSFGDGWDNTTIKITDKENSDSVVYSGGLKDGSQGTEYICLSENSACYHVDTSGGVWGKEVSWDIRGLSEGSVAIAGGGAPMSCDFPVAEGSCVSTCFGRPDEDPTKDPDYKQYKDMYNCIEKSCVIQLRACEKDQACVDCLQENVADRCHAVPTFNALIECSLCQCTDKKASDFCVQKKNPSMVIPGDKKPDGCTPGEILKGGTAVMTFSKCTDFDSVAMMVTNFHQNNFGDLDSFETCAHAFKANSGSVKALGCLQMLVNAKDGKMDDETSGMVPTETVAALAKLIYTDGENFCDCAKTASEDCPLCPSFIHFKTLLYESLDACMALDEIDCDAWAEFHLPCKQNLENAFGGVDFSQKQQCDYVRDGCGGVGPFPAFRHLDCDNEIDGTAWSFHNTFAAQCGTGNDSGGNDNPVPSPVSPPVAPVPPAPSPNQPKPYVPPSTPKPYVPPEKRGENNTSNDSSDKKSHWFRNLVLLSILGGVAFYLYKRRSDGFSFGRYRRMQRNFGEEDMYSGLAMEASTSFEPPTLPPTPAAIGGSQYNQY